MSYILVKGHFGGVLLGLHDLECLPILSKYKVDVRALASFRELFVPGIYYVAVFCDKQRLKGRAKAQGKCRGSTSQFSCPSV